MTDHHTRAVNPDDDVYVASLIRVGAADDVVERAREAVTADNFVQNPDSARTSTTRSRRG